LIGSSATTVREWPTTSIPPTLWDNDKLFPLNNPKFAAHQPLPATGKPERPGEAIGRIGATTIGGRDSGAGAQVFRENAARPFFLFVPSTIPHMSLQVPEDSLAEYVGKLEDTPYKGERRYLPHQHPHACYAAMVSAARQVRGGDRGGSGKTGIEGADDYRLHIG